VGHRGEVHPEPRPRLGVRLVDHLSLDLRPLDKLSFNLQWVYDRYSTSSGPAFAGQGGNIWWVTARYQLTRPLAVGAGVKWVTNPSPADVTGTATRNDPTVLVNLDYRTVLF